MTVAFKAALLALALVVGNAAQAAECKAVTFDGAPFTVCSADPAQDDIRLFLIDPATDMPYGQFDALDAALAAEGRTLVMAMNGGMYHADRRPVGHYVEDGVEVQRLITSAGPGNFGLLPNGVLCLTEDAARIIETRQFAHLSPDCVHATQSGPMLVVDGALHPQFLPGSTSRFIRNGVGVAADGTLFMAISDASVTFDHFGRLFRDELGTPNALYLDGSVSRLFAPRIGRADRGRPLGPILAVTAPAG